MHSNQSVTTDYNCRQRLFCFCFLFFVFKQQIHQKKSPTKSVIFAGADDAARKIFLFVFFHERYEGFLGGIINSQVHSKVKIK